ncbi:2,3-bisphosphoglycerate-independent phosphoglycerate mutase [Rhodobacteraceae bacterium NNCM2]|nr:2,3-bisphosphoglycerate-independent phosphoglycerate mutase [Coraliihabitans acroporae]
MPHRPVVLTILDGWGLRDEETGNAPRLAHTPNFDRIMAERPHSHLSASGEDVGLPAGQIGNSEVGHMNIGAGRVVWMDLPKINNSIEDGSFFANKELLTFMAKMKQSGGTAHLLGLVSPGGVHSHQRHISALAMALSEAGIPVAIHAFTDGRDVPQMSGREAMLTLLKDISPLNDVRIATVCGRFFAMDRDNRWERVAKAANLIVYAKGSHPKGAIDAIEKSYEKGVTDEFIEPAVIGDYQGMRPGDGILCANFRADRAREILATLLDPDFREFAIAPPRIAATLGMVSYSAKIDQWMPAMFPPDEIINTLGEWMAVNRKKQFRLAETEKYPHVTFFLNGGVEDPDPGEDRYMAPSPKVLTYDLQPEMSAGEVSEQLVKAIKGDYDLIVVNFANPDMVGHSGSLDAAIAACEAVDKELGAALDALAEVGGAMLVTADHGNCEVMIDPATGEPHPAHTTNPVPLILVTEGEGAPRHGLMNGRLADIAPTILALMGLSQPAEMTGRSLLVSG